MSQDHLTFCLLSLSVSLHHSLHSSTGIPCQPSLPGLAKMDPCQGDMRHFAEFRGGSGAVRNRQQENERTKRSCRCGGTGSALSLPPFLLSRASPQSEDHAV
uniref:Putative secreted protein n=1 Tax=Anopheles marajoara TaxID=58244 RepID=A0A2M4C8P9_9DIPT